MFESVRGRKEVKTFCLKLVNTNNLKNSFGVLRIELIFLSRALDSYCSFVILCDGARWSRVISN